MQQMNIDESKLVPINFESSDVPPAVRQFKPTLYKDGELFCCILGPDIEQGVHACGVTEDEAINEWTAALKERMQNTNPDDAVALYIKDTLATSKNDVW
jgi:hypothetical protein